MTKNLPNVECGNAAKIAGKNPPIGKQFWQVTVKVDSHRYKEKSTATPALWVRVEYCKTHITLGAVLR